MILMKKNILDKVYYRNYLGYDVVYSKATVTASGGVPGGGRNRIMITAGGVDFQVNALPWDERGELRASFWRPTNTAHW